MVAVVVSSCGVGDIKAVSGCVVCCSCSSFIASLALASRRDICCIHNSDCKLSGQIERSTFELL